MHREERRQAARIPCAIPVEVVRPEGWPPVLIRDLSRLGLCLYFPLDGAGRDVREGLAGLAGRLQASLEADLGVALFPTGRRAPIRRRLRVVRIGPRDRAGRHVEIGCRLDPPIEDAEAVALGLPLPVDGETAEEASRRLGEALPERHVADDGPQDALAVAWRGWMGKRCRAYLTSPEHPTQRPVLAEMESLSPSRVVLRVPDSRNLGLPSTARDVLSLVIAFDRTYGAEIGLKILDGGRHLWTGPARLEDVATIPGTPEQILLGFSFSRQLRRNELEALRLS